uniref:kelch-like protein 12 n=1 Tax=Styela clava TaxID=7725 RepID=UPI001939D7CD|nr:kelch-like protein 12 [Styela clava]
MEYSVDLDHMSHAVTILENLDEMRKNKQMCDFMIKVESEEFPAHKNVLSAGSDYFKAMLSHDTSEAQSGFVEMKHICPVSVKKCIDYIYSGKLLITKENIEQVLNTANMMQLQKICDGIFDFLAKELTPFSFHSTKDIAEFLIQPN